MVLDLPGAFNHQPVPVDDCPLTVKVVPNGNVVQCGGVFGVFSEDNDHVGKSQLLASQAVADQVMRLAGFVVFQDFGRGVGFQDVLVGIDREAAGAAGQVANALARATLTGVFGQ